MKDIYNWDSIIQDPRNLDPGNLDPRSLDPENLDPFDTFVLHLNNISQ